MIRAFSRLKRVLDEQNMTVTAVVVPHQLGDDGRGNLVGRPGLQILQTRELISAVNEDVGVNIVRWKLQLRDDPARRIVSPEDRKYLPLKGRFGDVLLRRSKVPGPKLWQRGRWSAHDRNVLESHFHRSQLLIGEN